MVNFIIIIVVCIWELTLYGILMGVAGIDWGDQS